MQNTPLIKEWIQQAIDIGYQWGNDSANGPWYKLESINTKYQSKIKELKQKIEKNENKQSRNVAKNGR